MKKCNGLLGVSLGVGGGVVVRFGGGQAAQDLEGLIVDLGGDLVQVGLGQVGDAGPLGQVASQDPVAVFVGASLPG